MRNRFSILFMVVVLVLGFAGPFPVMAADKKETTSIPDPILFQKEEPGISLTGKANNGNTETPGEWYIGDTPPNLIPNAPILLFVPGLNNTAQVFWEDNNMYQTARDAGYQTTFIQLHDAGGASASMWDNGALLAEKIREISTHFGGKPITVIAYSKGGVDTQTALTYYGAWQYVDNVITLSSPHHGSQLADLAYSSGAGWLADLLGAQGDGTYSMQMGEMANFRSQIEAQSRAYYNDYYTLGGTGWGSAFSSTWFGGMYLNQFGSNDGVVTTASSKLPRGTQIAISDWNHTSIRTGVTFSVFDDYISDQNLYSTSSLANQLENDSISKNDIVLNQWVQGGPLAAEKETEIALTVEDNVKEISLSLMTTNALEKLKFISPSGKVVTPKVTSKKVEEGIFIGALHHGVTLNAPMEGEWKIVIGSNQEDAYLLQAHFDSPKLITTGQNPRLVTNSQLQYELKADQTTVEESSLKATYHITQSNNPKNKYSVSVKNAKDLSKVLTFTKKNEVYNITIDIEGKTKNGTSFKRTIIDSVYVK
ncbi:esterase/lipase family protein [Ornithinibacillus scapharcae]|uniref:esterase/lipase family protein n=1 Tax=Ornithinibacillus scapharcae TaxID=1147159 RepID=UPI000225AD7D|nr:hypothetical protein [Ornithinibacillus scapharcae]